MPRVVNTDRFTKCLKSLRKRGKIGKDVELKARAAQQEAAHMGQISIVKRTQHGESRLPNIEKYDLGSGYRLVVQVVDPSAASRAFLFVGDHEDADRWLDNHKHYQWVKRTSDGTLDFVQVSDPADKATVVPSIDTHSPESLIALPLLRDVTELEWRSTRFPAEIVAYLSQVTGNDWERDPNGVLDHVEQVAGTALAVLASDILTHAHRAEWEQLHRRFESLTGQSQSVQGADAFDSMVDVANSDHFITWEDLQQLPDNSSWAEWMLFLHPEQKQYAQRDFNGPARLRGVSGSGKTCVMVHRARHLAKKYNQGVRLVTLTESMRRLLNALVEELCGVEAAHIKTSTMNALANDVIENLAENGLDSFSIPTPDQLEKGLNEIVAATRNHPLFHETTLSRLEDRQLTRFIDEEIRYVRMRYLPSEYDRYLTAPRYGRGLPLPEKARRICLQAVTQWDNGLRALKLKDHIGVAQTALELLIEASAAKCRSLRFRCVLVDEVQDLSQIEMRILSLIPTNDKERVSDLANGLFIVGDGAQTVYQKGFVLKDCGIRIANRSFVLRKNYRNTKEILEAAYGLIASYEFADVDEEDVKRPTEPDFPCRHGEKPFIVKCRTLEDECTFVAKSIRNLLDDQELLDEADELTKNTEMPICVIGFNRAMRDEIRRALESERIGCTELREDVGWESGTAKISTLESAKGHEFHAVFIVGLQENIIPRWGLEHSELGREASRLYVGMTRARDRLYLTYNMSRRPSVFLSAVQANCSEVEFREGRVCEGRYGG